MSAGTGGTTKLAAWGGYRRWLLVFASAATVFGLMHHTDHVIRGNHSGWPFQAEVTPFTFSLLIYALILPGIYLTARGRSVPGYHLFVAVVGLALLGFVHFVRLRITRRRSRISTWSTRVRSPRCSRSGYWPAS
jgi:hypothetical protein